MTPDVKTRVHAPKPIFKAEMLVQHIADGSIGIVVNVTRKYVHVVWLANVAASFGSQFETDPKDDGTHSDFEGMHHYVGHYPRKVLTPCTLGTTVYVKQVQR